MLETQNPRIQVPGYSQTCSRKDPNVSSPQQYGFSRGAYLFRGTTIAKMLAKELSARIRGIKAKLRIVC